MKQNCRIVLFGKSVIVGTVGASLQTSSLYDLRLLTHEHPEELIAIKPDVVIFDLELTRPEEILPYLADICDLMLMVISPDSNLVKFWERRQLRELSTLGLMGVINNHYDSYSPPEMVRLPQQVT